MKQQWVDYSELTREQLYKLIALKNRHAIEFIYHKYAPAIYGIIIKKVENRQEANNIFCRTFKFFFQAQPDKSRPLPGIFIRLYNIAEGMMNKKSMLYPIRSEYNIQSLKIYS